MISVVVFGNRGIMYPRLSWKCAVQQMMTFNSSSSPFIAQVLECYAPQCLALGKEFLNNDPKMCYPRQEQRALIW